MNYDVMAGTAGAGDALAYAIGFGVVMLVGWLLTRGRP